MFFDLQVRRLLIQPGFLKFQSNENKVGKTGKTFFTNNVSSFANGICKPNSRGYINTVAISTVLRSIIEN